MPEPQLALWPQLSGSRELGLVLYGGTAIGLRLGHRPSIDFDFFTEAPLNRESLSRSFPFLPRSQVLVQQSDTLTVLAPGTGSSFESVKVSFFFSLNFGRVGHPETTDDGICEVASLSDLMASKVKVILQRIEAKDYSDIAAMLRAGVSLDHGLASARSLYAPAFQPNESLKALTFFEGGDLDVLSVRDREVLVEAARKVHRLPHVERIAFQLSEGVG